MNRIFRAGFVEKGDPAHRFLDGWQWTDRDQNTVVQPIVDEERDPRTRWPGGSERPRIPEGTAPRP